MAPYEAGNGLTETKAWLEELANSNETSKGSIPRNLPRTEMCDNRDIRLRAQYSGYAADLGTLKEHKAQPIFFEKFL
jgi:hypothetical protein